jgi:AhpD family alkylhydroperoxidase
MHAERQFPPKMAPEGYAALSGVEAYIQRCGLPPQLVELVKLRASQLNGCSFCLDMHSKDARRHGETEQRLYVLSGWRDSPLYTPTERAALAWTEALTLVSDTHAPDSDYEPLSQHFSDKEITDLTILIGMINLWNRLAIGMRYVHDGAPAGASR